MAERGDAPSDVLRAVEERRPRIPWQRVFRQFVGQAIANDDYSLRRPNRRFVVEDMVVPSMHAERVGQVVIALDTSASMKPETLAEVSAEIGHLARETSWGRVLCTTGDG